MTPRFDPTRAIIYDLARGQLRDDEGTARLNLPLHLLNSLLQAAGAESAEEFARGLGSEIGRRVKDRMGESASGATVESWTEHLGGQVALVGLGDLAVENWGKALVLRVAGAPDGAANFLGPVLETAIQRGLSRDVRLVKFHGPEGDSFLVLSPSAAARAKQMMESGSGLGSVVEALHQGDA